MEIIYLTCFTHVSILILIIIQFESKHIFLSANRLKALSLAGNIQTYKQTRKVKPASDPHIQQCLNSAYLRKNAIVPAQRASRIHHHLNTFFIPILFPFSSGLP